MSTAFRFEAARADGRLERGVIAGANPAEVVGMLRSRGLHPIDLAPMVNPRRPLRRGDLALVFRSLATFVEAGIPLERAIEAAIETGSESVRAGLNTVLAGLRRGASLDEALGEASGFVPEGVRGVVRAGERAGRLAGTLAELADHLEQEAALEAKVRQALAYPTLLLVVGVASVTLIVSWVVPRFGAILSEAGQELPWLTRGLLGAASFASVALPALMVATAAVLILGRRWLTEPAKQLAWHRLLLSVPWIGPLRQTLAAARLSRTLGTALQSGMAALPALTIAADAAGDHAIADRVRLALAKVANGARIVPSLAEVGAAPAQVLQLMSAGEGSGRLAAMSLKAAEVAALDATSRLNTIVSMLEPTMIIVFGGLVAIVAAGLLQAVYAIRPL